MPRGALKYNTGKCYIKHFNDQMFQKKYCLDNRYKIKSYVWNNKNNSIYTKYNSFSLNCYISQKDFFFDKNKTQIFTDFLSLHSELCITNPVEYSVTSVNISGKQNGAYYVYKWTYDNAIQILLFLNILKLCRLFRCLYNIQQMAISVHVQSHSDTI